ncbi:hypothetical protein A3731_18465 [Roseovarius sp. HI0049]|nr:hypothetical protein A3731_18465 [Roseovarius sp. HI0049]
MYVFIDESGDPGFKIERGSSPIFVTSMVIFDTAEDASEATKEIAALRARLRVKPEFKFNKSHAAVRDAFFEGVSGLTFRTRYVVV